MQRQPVTDTASVTDTCDFNNGLDYVVVCWTTDAEYIANLVNVNMWL